ncbi:MAG: hypothetical protein GY744_18690, partial [Gammaproteobacteria bacterium]|nr:hypothetical protein [Gammaproteobacteria bacterium]
MNGEYISKEFQMIRKDGRSDGSPRKHPKNGYAKYEIFDIDTPITPWVKVDGKLNDISVADDGTVWGIDSNNGIYSRNTDNSAREKISGLPGQFMSIVQLSHDSDSGVVWGVNSNNEIYHRKDDISEWGKVPGRLKQVSVAADGTVWGVNKKNEIYRRNSDDSAWEKVPGRLKQISVACDSTIWGVNKKNEIYRREYENRSWKKIPGALKQVSVASYAA